jgi:hypothetical protein
VEADGGSGHWVSLGVRAWHMKQLGEQREVPVEEVPIDAIPDIDQDCWFKGDRPPCERSSATPDRSRMPICPCR